MTAPLRAAHDPHLTASTRRRHVRLELVLVVRRAERGFSSRLPYDMASAGQAGDEQPGETVAAGCSSGTVIDAGGSTRPR
jgi:hypothetical protein